MIRSQCDHEICGKLLRLLKNVVCPFLEKLCIQEKLSKLQMFYTVYRNIHSVQDRS